VLPLIFCACLGKTFKYLRRTTRGAAGNGRAQQPSTCDEPRAAPREPISLGTTTKYLRGAASIGLGTTTEFLQRTASGAAGKGLCTTI
jgi:hypothetical protein